MIAQNALHDRADKNASGAITPCYPCAISAIALDNSLATRLSCTGSPVRYGRTFRGCGGLDVSQAARQRGGIRRRGLCCRLVLYIGRPQSGRRRRRVTPHSVFRPRRLAQRRLHAWRLLMAPGPIDRDGLLLKVLMSGGLYRYNCANLGGERVIGAETTIQVMPGFKIKRGDLEAKFFMGLDAEEHRLWPDDPSNSLPGHMWGMRVLT